MSERTLQGWAFGDVGWQQGWPRMLRFDDTLIFFPRQCEVAGASNSPLEAKPDTKVPTCAEI